MAGQLPVPRRQGADLATAAGCTQGGCSSLGAWQAGCSRHGGTALPAGPAQAGRIPRCKHAGAARARCGTRWGRPRDTHALVVPTATPACGGHRGPTPPHTHPGHGLVRARGSSPRRHCPHASTVPRGCSSHALSPCPPQGPAVAVFPFSQESRDGAARWPRPGQGPHRSTGVRHSPKAEEREEPRWQLPKRRRGGPRQALDSSAWGRGRWWEPELEPDTAAPDTRLSRRRTKLRPRTGLSARAGAQQRCGGRAGLCGAGPLRPRQGHGQHRAGEVTDAMRAALRQRGRAGCRNGARETSGSWRADAEPCTRREPPGGRGRLGSTNVGASSTPNTSPERARPR